MPVYQRETRVRAPFEEVWSFHSEVSGLEALTPGFMHLDVEEVVGPDGDRDPGVLEAGTAITMSMRPFGVGPRQRWVSRITDREESAGAGMFRDVMEGGPFRRWVHTHRFFADGDETIVSDRVSYRLPFGPLGDAAGPVAVVGFEPMFRGRHRETKRLLEK
jgi:ligand-binding SRPBCC domain-containing protein